MNPMFGCGGVLWKLVPFSILWSIWKERNDSIFKGASVSVDDLSFNVTRRITKWASLRSEVNG